MRNFNKEPDNREKYKILCHLVKNVVHPQGYTFFSYLVNENQTELIKEALKIKGLKYSTDKNGISPLLLAIKNKNYKIM